VIEADETLIYRSQHGDRQAFEELLRSSARLVFAQAFLEAGSRELAEDLTQETFLTAWRSIGQLKDAKAFRPWLLSILHRTVIDSVRRSTRQKRRNAVAQDDLITVHDSSTGPAESAQRNEELQHALSIIRSLPEDYRNALMLRYIAGADYETISRQLALTNGSLRGLLHRGLAMLKSEMNKGEKHHD
jgi:RNA polymerase sigma-70 factor (ECF subfamily)